MVNAQYETTRRWCVGLHKASISSNVIDEGTRCNLLRTCDTMRHVGLDDYSAVQD